MKVSFKAAAGSHPLSSSVHADPFHLGPCNLYSAPFLRQYAGAWLSIARRDVGGWGWGGDEWGGVMQRAASKGTSPGPQDARQP